MGRYTAKTYILKLNDLSPLKHCRDYLVTDMLDISDTGTVQLIQTFLEGKLA